MAQQDAFMSGSTIAILGYSDDGQWHAKELRNKGFKVVIGLRDIDPYWDEARKDGFEVHSLWEAVQQADVIQVW